MRAWPSRSARRWRSIAARLRLRRRLHRLAGDELPSGPGVGGRAEHRASGRREAARARPLGAAGRPVTVAHPAGAPGTADAPSGAALNVVVDLVEALGADTLVHGRVGGIEDALLARLPGNAVVRADDRIAFEVAAGEIQLFDPEYRKVDPAKPETQMIRRRAHLPLPACRSAQQRPHPPVLRAAGGSFCRRVRFRTDLPEKETP